MFMCVSCIRFVSEACCAFSSFTTHQVVLLVLDITTCVFPRTAFSVQPQPCCGPPLTPSLLSLRLRWGPHRADHEALCSPSLGQRLPAWARRDSSYGTSGRAPALAHLGTPTTTLTVVIHKIQRIVRFGTSLGHGLI